ncbi:MAG: MerR family transcriptional regulator [Candidatus Schekmanbacteria bacterium]|nr:MerR family transcriptional regulator [Candidatus Schekmanbacteria bacterium]
MADLLGISPRTLRYYEQIGLLDALSRVDGKVRYYNNKTAFLVKTIKDLQCMGLTLEEIREIRFLFQTDPSREKPKQKMLEKLAEQKKNALSKMQELNRFIDQIDDYMKRIEMIKPKSVIPDGDIID